MASLIQPIFICTHCGYNYALVVLKGETQRRFTGNSLEELLTTITPDTHIPQRITISRDLLLSDSVRFFKRREFDYKSAVRVVFEGEPAVDGGGPKREYFTLLLQSLLSPSAPIRLFEGRESFIMPMHNMDAIRAGMFKVAGRMITTSVTNGGPGFPVLSPVLYKYLVTPTGDIDKILSEITKDDVVDWNIVEAVERVSRYVRLLVNPQNRFLIGLGTVLIFAGS